MAQAKDVKMAHVNLMADTIIANLPEEGLRSVLRSMLATDPSIVPIFEHRTADYLRKITRTNSSTFFHVEGGQARPTAELRFAQQRLRSMLGCGMCYEAVPLLSAIVQALGEAKGQCLSSSLTEILTTLDGDIVQMVTAIQKTLMSSSGSRHLAPDQRASLDDLLESLRRSSDGGPSGDFILNRSLAAVTGLLDVKLPNLMIQVTKDSKPTVPPTEKVETFRLDERLLPRLFTGLWQLSSPSWGSASATQVQSQFQVHASQHFSAFDMADHYGDAEILFGTFRASCLNPEQVFGATKYCVFTPLAVTRELVAANIMERCERTKADYIDLLQFHWQRYQDKQYLKALVYLAEDPRVRAIGLCNFDTEHTEEIVDAGIKIHTNQVQFSLIDSRPIFKMAAVCEKYDIKLLTYGTLCGGFIADKWLNQFEPELFHGGITPSQRKYYEMIVNWGGWSLFQELLRVLRIIAEKYNVAISNVATRWVLDFDYVGAVIIGTRMGVSEHARENLATYGWHLDAVDRAAIENVLSRSRRSQLIDVLGDCGGEYR